MTTSSLGWPRTSWTRVASRPEAAAAAGAAEEASPLLLLLAPRCASGASRASEAPTRPGSRFPSSTTAGVSFVLWFSSSCKKREREKEREREKRRRGKKNQLSLIFLSTKTFPLLGPGFATSKSFAWCDEYNPASAPSRKVRRLVEEANRKKRSKAKREFNETVRALAAFVRRRDRRAVAAAAAAAAKRAAAAEAEAQRRSAEKATRAARAAAYREQMEHEGGEEDERGGGGGGGGRGSGGGSDDTESSKEEELVLLECVACNKRFRSDAAFSNHERSRKHSEAVAALRAALAEVREEEEDDSPPPFLYFLPLKR